MDAMDCITSTSTLSSGMAAVLNIPVISSIPYHNNFSTDADKLTEDGSAENITLVDSTAPALQSETALTFNTINLSSVKIPIVNFSVPTSSIIDRSLLALPVNSSDTNTTRLCSSSLPDVDTTALSDGILSCIDQDASGFQSLAAPCEAKLSSVPIHSVAVPSKFVDYISPRFRSIRPVVAPEEFTEDLTAANRDSDDEGFHIDCLTSSPHNYDLAAWHQDRNQDTNISIENCHLDTVDSRVASAVITVNDIDCDTGDIGVVVAEDMMEVCSSNQIENGDKLASYMCNAGTARLLDCKQLVDMSEVDEQTQDNFGPTPVFNDRHQSGCVARVLSVETSSNSNTDFLAYNQINFLNSPDQVMNVNEAVIHPNFFCLICGKSGMVSVQTSLKNAIPGKSQIEFLDIIVNILKTNSDEFHERSDKICTKCLEMINEIESLRQSLHVKESQVRETYMASTWVDKLQTEDSRGADIAGLLFSETGVNKVQHHQDTATLKESTTNVDHFRLQQKDIAAVNSKAPESATESSRRRKRYRCLKCHTSFFSSQDRKNHMRRCKKDKIPDDEDYSEEKEAITAPASPSSESKVPRTKSKRSRSYPCDQCEKWFSSRSRLLAHSSSHSTTFDCYVCGRFLTTKARLLAHMFKFHGIGEGKSKCFKCNLCDKSFQTKAGLSYHMNVAHQVGTKYTCEHCPKVYYYHAPYKSHMLFAHGKKTIVCETCGDMFFTVSKLNTHINAVHRNAETWQCVECDVKFTTGTAFRHHNLMKHHNTKFACDYCSAQFRKRSSLYDHLKEHSIYTCNICKTAFDKELLYNTHMFEVHQQVAPKLIKKRPHVPSLLTNTKKSRVKAATSKPVNANKNKQEMVAAEQFNQLHRINLNDILLTNSYSSTSNLQVFNSISSDKLANLNLTESSDKIQSYNLLDSETGLEIPSNSNTLAIGDAVSFMNVEILDSIEINDSRTELNEPSGQHHLSVSEMPDMSSLTGGLGDSVPSFGHVATEQGGAGGSNVGVVSHSVEDITNTTQLESSMGHLHESGDLNHSPADVHHGLEPSVSELSAPAAVVDMTHPSVDLSQSDDIIETASCDVHHLTAGEGDDKGIDPSAIWLKENAWAMLKGPSADENLGNLTTLQSLPSSGIDDLDIGVIGNDNIVDDDVISVSEAIDLGINVGSDKADDGLDLNVDDMSG